MPQDVAALVDGLKADETSVTLVNLSPTRSRTVVIQAGGYGDLTSVAGCPDHLAFAHTGDNLGPPSVDDVVASFAIGRSRSTFATATLSSVRVLAMSAPRSTFV